MQFEERLVSGYAFRHTDPAARFETGFSRWARGQAPAAKAACSCAVDGIAEAMP